MLVVNDSNETVLTTVQSASAIIQPSVEFIAIEATGQDTINVHVQETIVVEKESSSVVVTGMVGPQGPPSEDDIMYSKRIDFVSDLELYRAEAAVGSSESSPVWRIRKITIGNDGDVTEMWASGDATFTKVWANRAIYNYS